MHDETHDPIRDHAECAVCNESLRRAFNRLADSDLGPNDVDVMMTKLRELAGKDPFPDLGAA